MTASATPARSRDLVDERGAPRRGRDRAQPDAQPVCRRPCALRPLFAVEPAVPQSALSPIRRWCSARRASRRRRHAAAGRQHGALIDWPAAARAKYALLRRLFDDFVANELRDPPLAADFAVFVREGGERLREHALFEALHQHWFGAPEPKWSWSDWPDDWRAPHGAAVARFAAAESRAIEFHLFLQWIAARSFASVQHGARDAGMRIGLIADLAIGMNPGGSHAWSRQQDLLLGLNVGAPPDLFNTRGQDWGLTGVLAAGPGRAAASSHSSRPCAPPCAMPAACASITSMGLARLWLVPQGASPTDGAYLAYPVDDLLRLLALELHRHRAIVIGEDLGTVEPAFRKRLAERRHRRHGRALVPARRTSRFCAPARWRRDAVAMTTTHDLPTVAGWWQGADIATRARARPRRGRAARSAGARQGSRRAVARLPQGRRCRRGATRRPRRTMPHPRSMPRSRFTAQSPAPLALIPIEDILGLDRTAERSRHDRRASELAAPSRRARRGDPRRAAGASAPRDLARAAHMTPRATMRLQFHKGFTFADAEAARPLPRAARHQPCLRVADHHRARRARCTAMT